MQPWLSWELPSKPQGHWTHRVPCLWLSRAIITASTTTAAATTTWLWRIFISDIGLSSLQVPCRPHLFNFMLIFFLLLPCAVDCISTGYCCVKQHLLSYCSCSVLLIFFLSPDHGFPCFVFYLPSDLRLRGRHCGIHCFWGVGFFWWPFQVPHFPLAGVRLALLHFAAPCSCWWSVQQPVSQTDSSWPLRGRFLRAMPGVLCAARSQGLGCSLPMWTQEWSYLCSAELFPHSTVYEDDYPSNNPRGSLYRLPELPLGVLCCSCCYCSF